MSLRAGDWVEVKGAEEILATLDERGELDALPFMPEMLQYCGRRFRIFKSAHKTCDTIKTHKARRVRSAVHLEGLRCDGEAHGGCQASCLLFWKEAWLKPVRGTEAPADTATVKMSSKSSRCSLATLNRATRKPTEVGGVAEERYQCQATQMFVATEALRWWDPRQYAMDLASGNVALLDLIRYGLLAAYNILMRSYWRFRPYPFVRPLGNGKTPTPKLNLQPGELVQIRSKTEIMLTLNERQRTRGLRFDVEMLPYCGKTVRVLRRVDRLINEETGAMIHMSNECLILDGVTCGGLLSRDRMFCPRSIYPYWREAWLQRGDGAGPHAAKDHD